MGVLFLIGSGKEAPSLVTDLLDVDKNPRQESNFSLTPKCHLML